MTDRVICTKNFTPAELKQFRDVIILDYLAELNIGAKIKFLNFFIWILKLDEIDIYDVIGIMSAENDRYFLKTKIVFNLFVDEEKRVP